MFKKLIYYIKEYGLINFILKVAQRGIFILSSLVLSKIFKNKIDRDIYKFITKLSYDKTIVFSLPCLSYGGAELYIRNIAQCVNQINSKINIVFFITDNIGSINLSVLDNHPYIQLFAVRDYTKFSNLLSPSYFIRFIELSNPLILHNALSETVGRLIRFNHEKIRQSVKKIYASWFTYEVDKYGNTIDRTSSYILESLPYIDLVITDNNKFIQDTRVLLSENLDNMQFNKIVTVYNACKIDLNKLPSLKVISCALDKVNNFLWIGRLDHQKNIGMLYNIAEMIPLANFYVYGSSIIGNEFINSKPSNVYLCGVELNIYKIIRERQYKAFIMTSLYEGLPNVLIEMGYFSIPIIAPDVGGVSELINNDTGFLLSSKPTVAEYINCINSINFNSEGVKRKATNLFELVKLRHSYASMRQSLIELKYLDI